MPLYRFKCEKCGQSVEELRPMRECRDDCICECGNNMERDYTIGKYVTCGDKERVSTALGVHVSQIESGEVYKVHPGARFTPDGYMILRNRVEQRQRLKERHWRNFDSYSDY